MQPTHRYVPADGSTALGTLPITCRLDDADRASRLESLQADLFAGAEEWQELESGYVVRFPGAGDWGAKIADFVKTERYCCSFFRFELTFEPNLGPIWLRLTGPDGVKEFIEAMMRA